MLMQNLGGQTKSIMVFSEVAYGVCRVLSTDRRHVVAEVSFIYRRIVG